KPAPYRRAVAHNVQIAGAKIDDPVACRVFYIGVADIPLLRDGPVECSSPGRDFVNRKVYVFAKATECFAYSVASDAPTDGEYITRERENFLTNFWTIEAFNHGCVNPG